MSWASGSFADRRPAWKRRNGVGVCGLKYCDGKLRHRIHLMCPAHWRLVPKELQDAVWASFRKGSADQHRTACEFALSAADQAYRPVDGRLQAVQDGLIVCHCGCGISYTILEWLGLPDAADQPDGHIVLELRTCECKSTRGVYRDELGVYIARPEDTEEAKA